LEISILHRDNQIYCLAGPNMPPPEYQQFKTTKNLAIE